jgi:hypothetical protein
MLFFYGIKLKWEILAESCVFSGHPDTPMLKTTTLTLYTLLSPRAGHRNCPKNLGLSKPTDLTIHWKALDEHLLTVHVPLVFHFNHFWMQNAFSEFFSKPPSPYLSY